MAPAWRPLLTRSSLPPQLVKLCSGMIEAGKAYVGANKLFVSGIRDLSQHCQRDQVTSVRTPILDPPGPGPPFRLRPLTAHVCLRRSSWRSAAKVCRKSSTTTR